MRIGYGITTKEIADVLNKVREPFNINRFAQVAALAALKNKDFLKKVVNYTQKEKKYIYKELGNLGLSFMISATNFVLVDFNKSSRSLCQYLLKQGIIVRSLSSWGLNNFFRITVGLRKENEKFIWYHKKYLRK